MTKPPKHEKPTKPTAKARAVKARQSLNAMTKDLMAWKRKGLPHREPITQAEVDRRIALYRECASLLRGEV